MMDKLEMARRELARLSWELAVVQEQLAGPRMRWRRVCDDIRARCIGGGPRHLVWQPLGAENIATLDRERAIYLDVTRDLTPQERVLKDAVRVTALDVKRLKKAATEPARKTAPPVRRTPLQPVLGDLFA